jgi:tRNA pseudouridine55 synthase
LALSGILLVDKPPGISSAQAIRKIERHFKIAKIGHGGTLDPFASGLLVVILGEATKIARFLLADRKGYEALARVGWETTTADLEGEEKDIPRASQVSIEAWKKSQTQFLGKIQQTPPIFSALKVDGRRLYDYARKGEAVEVKAREVEIFELELLELKADSTRFRVECGGGTYIRTLAEDWAKAAGTLAHLQELRRYRVGSFSLANAKPLADILDTPRENIASLEIVSISDALAHFPSHAASPDLSARVRRGDQSTLASEVNNNAEFLLLTEGGEARHPLALLSLSPSGYKLERVFAP